MTYYVKLIGSRDMPMPDDWWGRSTDEYEVRFPPPLPKEITPGDELVYYAVGGYKSIIATGRVNGFPVRQPMHPNPEIARRWPFAAEAEMDPATRVRFVSSGPPLIAVGPDLQKRIGPHVSHFEIGRVEFDRAVQLLRRAVNDEKRKLKARP